MKFRLGVPIIMNKVKEVQGNTVVVRWEPPLEGACPVVSYNVYHREVFSPASKSKWNSATVNRNSTNHTLYLNCRKQYELAVTSVNSHGESEFQIWNFRTKGGNGILLTLRLKQRCLKQIQIFKINTAPTPLGPVI